MPQRKDEAKKTFQDMAGTHSARITQSTLTSFGKGKGLRESVEIKYPVTDYLTNLLSLRPFGYISIPKKNTFALVNKYAGSENAYYVAGTLDVIDNNSIASLAPLAEGETLLYSDKVAKYFGNNALINLIESANGKFDNLTEVSGKDVIIAISDLCKIVRDMASSIDGAMGTLNTTFNSHTHSNGNGGNPTGAPNNGSMSMPQTQASTNGAAAMAVEPQLINILVNQQYKPYTKVK